MPRKRDVVRVIDQKANVEGGGGVVIDSQTSTAPPAVGNINPPTNLTIISQVISKSAQTSEVLINVSWLAPAHTMPEKYIIQYGQNYNVVTGVFTEPTVVTSTNLTAALTAIPNKTYYIRIAAQVANSISQWSDVLSVVSLEDLSTPPNVLNINVVFSSGNVIIVWDTPVSDLYKDAHIKIYNAAGTIKYVDLYVSGTSFIWTESENLRLSGGITSVLVSVNSRGWNNVENTTISSNITMTAPNAPTSLIADFSTGDLSLKWTNPTNTTYRYIEIILYNDNTKALIRARRQTNANYLVYSADENLFDTSNVGDPTLYYEVYVVSWLGVTSTKVTGSVTKPAPAAPTSLTTSWTGDTGLADENVNITWNNVANIKDYIIEINGTKTYTTITTSLLYTLAMNLFDFITPDPTLSIRVAARDRLNQITYSSIIDIVNVAPDVTTVVSTVNNGFSTIGVFLTSVPNIQDLQYYIYRAYLSGTLSAEIKSEATAIGFSDLAAGTYEIRLTAVDLFGQTGTEKVLSSNAKADGVSVQYLREEAIHYNNGVLVSNSLLRDGTIIVSEAPVNYITLPVSASYSILTLERPTIDRYGAITLGGLLGTTMNFYFSTSIDGINWLFFAGFSITNGRYVLTSRTTEAIAITNASTLNDAFNNTQFNSTGYLFEIPTITEARFVRLHYKVNTTATKLTEFYARRLVTGDDIKGETITGINIVGATITGDKVFGTELSSVKSFTGQLVINTGGFIRSGQSAYNTGTGYFLETTAGGVPRFSFGSTSSNFTFDGTNITFDRIKAIFRSSVVNQRVELDGNGLTAYNSSNVVQVQIRSSDGYLLAGGGNVTLNAAGLTLLSGVGTPNKINWLFNGVDNARMYSANPSTTVQDFWVECSATNTANINIRATSSTSNPTFELMARTNTISYAVFNDYTNGNILRVGINTFAPTETFHVNGSSLLNLTMVSGRLGVSDNIKIIPTITLAIGDTDTGIRWNSDGNISIMANNVATATITPSSVIFNINVGLSANSTFTTLTGTTVSATTLSASGTVTGSNGVYSSNWFRGYGDTGWYNETHGGGIYMHAGDNTKVRVYGGKIFRMSIETGNSVTALGSGTGNIQEISEVYMNSGFNNVTLRFRGYRTTAASSWETAAMRIHRWTDGVAQGYISFTQSSIGINTDATGFDLIVLSTAAKPGGGSWSATSDDRTKSNVRDFNHGLEDLKALPKLISFKYNGLYGTNNNNVEYVGYSAQALLTVAPKMVDTYLARKDVDADEEEIIYNVNLSTVEHMQTNAILELANRLEAVERKLV